MSKKQRQTVSIIKRIWQGQKSATGHISLLINRRRSYIFLAGLVLLLSLISFGLLIGQSAVFIAEIVIGFLCSLLALLHPRFSLMLIFIGAALPSLLLNLPGHTMRPVEPALYIGVLVIVLHRPGIRLRSYHLLALLFLAIAVISFLHVPQISTDPNMYAADKRLYEILLILEAFFCGTCLVRYVKDTSTLLSTLLLCNIPFYLIGLVQFVGMPLPVSLEPVNAQEFLQTGQRLSGPTDGAVTFGLYLVNLLAVALSCYILGKRRRDRVIGGLMTLITTLELAGSGTRSAALGGIVMIFALLLFTRRYKFLIALLCIVSALLILFFDKIAPLFSHDQTSITNRLLLWREALHLIMSHPLIGIGLQQFYVYYAQLIIGPSAALNQHGISVHNQYLELALESGIAWLIVALLLLFSIVYTCWQAYYKVQRDQRALLLAALLALIANIVIGFFDVPLDKAEGSVVLFLLAGLALGCVEKVRRNTISKQPLPPTMAHKHGFFSIPGRLFSRLRIPGPSVDATPNARKTVRTITFQLLCWGLTGPVMLPVTALLTRYLGPVQYGEYGFTFPFLAICALLTGTGMDPLIIRLLSRLPRTEWSATLSYAAGSRCLLTAVSVATLTLVVLLLPFSNEQRYLLLFGCFSLFFNFSYNGLRVIYSHGFRAEQRVTLLILLETIDRLLTAAMVIMVVLLRLPLLWVYVLIIYVDLPCCIVLMFIARRRFGIRMRLSFHHLRIHLLESLSLTGYDALALLTGQADIILLMLFTGPLNVGLYALAIRISDPLLSVAYMYVNGIYPLLCSIFEKRYAQFATFYKEAIRIISLAIIPPSIFVCMQADAIVSLMGGQHFAAAAIVVQLLMWATATIFYSQLAARSCMAADMERWIPYVAGAAAVLNLLGNFVLIPLWQAVGAAFASLVSEMLALLLFMLLLRRHIQLLPTFGIILQVALGNTLMLAFLFWQRHASLLLTAPIALILAITGCFITRVLSWRDLQMVRRFLFTHHLSSDLENAAREERKPLSIAPFNPGPLDVVEYSVPLLPQFQDITDRPTLILPRIRV